MTNNSITYAESIKLLINTFIDSILRLNVIKQHILSLRDFRIADAFIKPLKWCIYDEISYIDTSRIVPMLTRSISLGTIICIVVNIIIGIISIFNFKANISYGLMGFIGTLVSSGISILIGGLIIMVLNSYKYRWSKYAYMIVSYIILIGSIIACVVQTINIFSTTIAIVFTGIINVLTTMLKSTSIILYSLLLVAAIIKVNPVTKSDEQNSDRASRMGFSKGYNTQDYIDANDNDYS